MNEIELLDEISYIGYLLLRYGADIHRVEESLYKMLEGLGYKDIEVFALPDYFTFSCRLSNNNMYTITKRSTKNRTNLDKICSLNQLVRDISNNEIEIDSIHNRILSILEQPLNYNLILLGYILSAIFFTLFFGGGIRDVIVAGFNGCLIYYAILLMENLYINSIMITIIASMLTALSSLLFKYIGLINTIDYSIIGTIMILTPGLIITNSVSDIIRGNYVSGISRFLEAFLIASSIAIGVGIVLVIGGHL